MMIQHAVYMSGWCGGVPAARHDESGENRYITHYSLLYVYFDSNVTQGTVFLVKEAITASTIASQQTVYSGDRHSGVCSFPFCSVFFSFITPNTNIRVGQ